MVQMKRFYTKSAAETHALGMALGQAIRSTTVLSEGRAWDEPLVIALHGELGAGKTLITQGLAQSLGVATRVTSPTFVFVNEYTTAIDKVLVHIDSYRLGDAPDDAAIEALGFGVEEILTNEEAIVVIEWAERLHDLLPADHLAITLTYTAATPDEREIFCAAHGSVSRAILVALVNHVSISP